MTNESNNTLDNIKDRLQTILDRKFSSDNRIRRKIDIYHDRWNFCCPYCNDSKSDIRKKRGNLYINTLRYFCFNCGHSTGINKLLSDFGEELQLEDKAWVREIQQSSKKLEKRRSATQSSMSFTILEKIAVPKSIFFKQLGLISPYKNEFASGYLKSRKIDIKFWKFFAFNQTTQELYILNITPDDRIIGFQIRQLDPNSKKARYVSRCLTKMYSEIFNKNISAIVEKIILQEKLGEKYIEEEDGMENIMSNLDRISGMFNIMNVDMSRTLTIMEGPIDSLAIDNSIALQGASKKLNGFFDDMENIRYVFDNDKTGKEMSIRKLKDHKKVFLWEMYIRKVCKNKKIKDLNDLLKNNEFNIQEIENCFSDDEFDAMYI